MTTQSSPGGYLVKDFADGWYWTPNAASAHEGGAAVWSIEDNRYETVPLALAIPPAATEDAHRTMDGETVWGFKVAAWRYVGPQDPDDARFGHRYCEHWSTIGNAPKKVERLFTEDQLRAALSAAPAPEGGAVTWRIGDRVSLHSGGRGTIVNVRYGLAMDLEDGSPDLGWAPKDFLDTDPEDFIIATREKAPASALDNLVDRFAAALKEKLHASEAKYGHNDAWMRDDWLDDLIEQLGEHVQKGDPRDVAAYCAFAWHHGWSLTPRHEAPASDGEREPLCMAYKTGYAEGVEDSNGMFDRESCEEGWGQYAEKLSAQPALPAHPTASDIAKFADANMTPEAKIKSDTAQPQAREDAQPDTDCVSCEDRPASGNNPCASCGRTHPAPDALRVAVEALEAINHIRSEMVGVPVDSEAANAWAMALDAAADHARQALAALQAEQKGGA